MTTARLLYLLSPAKTLDMTLSTVKVCSAPQLLHEAHILLQELSQAKVKSLLGVSDALARLNYQRFQNFAIVLDEKKEADLVPDETHKQAVLSFNGPAYQGIRFIALAICLAAQELSGKELQYAQDHLRILCGLYGILRPLDLIQAYRLEMGQKFANSRGKDLYAFWGTTLSEQINAYFRENEVKKEQKVIVNVASQEYFKSIPLEALDDDIQVIDCVFQDDGKIKSVYAKRARGLMCRYLIQNQVDSIESIKKFDLEGYVFTTTASNETTFVFNRTAAKQKQVLKEIQAQAKLKKEQQSQAAATPSVKEEPKKKAKGDTVPEAEDAAENKLPTRVSTRKRRKTE
uniref:Uncharacterized protein n=1 Tax=Globisporangium ultimum (strain ATCC 200006 / CBS 805.95 / DAOM BR144) TaxID=431595 RepID=K3X0J3_GLOUD